MQPTDYLVGETATLEASMAQIDSNGKGVVFITNDDGRLLGSVSDGDIRRAILDGAQLRDPVTSVMNDDPVALEAGVDEGPRDVGSSEVQRVRERTHSDDTLLVPVLDDEETVVDVRWLTADGRQRRRDADSAPKAVDSVLVVGGAGYIGSVLCRQLLDRGYDVRVLDKVFYTDESLADLREHERFSFTRGDMRSIPTVMEAIEGVDAVVFLAALVGDPASAIDSRRTLELNYHSLKLMADVCKYHQVNRFVFASTCSVYGESDAADLLSETDDINPVSLYGKTKVSAEEALLSMTDENFAPTILRKGTVYGLSPRMRFDLVVNVLTAKAVNEGEIPIFGGDQYRPMVHVADAARAYVRCLEAPLEDVRGQVFNIGSNEQNYRIEELGEIVEDCIPGAEIERQAGQTDDRSYRVDFSKAREVLGYEAERTVRDGCLEIADALRSGDIADYERDVYNNYRTVNGSTDVLETT